MNVTLIALLTDPFIITVFNIQNLVMLSIRANNFLSLHFSLLRHSIFHFKEKKNVIQDPREREIRWLNF